MAAGVDRGVRGGVVPADGEDMSGRRRSNQPATAKVLGVVGERGGPLASNRSRQRCRARRGGPEPHLAGDEEGRRWSGKTAEAASQQGSGRASRNSRIKSSKGRL
ncbi:hypothetical protein QYE76_064595 [Lolium multiflorum]|uniref:Uncharacterized protein n=1 Tax=Lolium multiflorum TaxID=4521 RepID=A0AAD8W990_LOLMU|nr:hypothetical protein QYE76_064595 [Lolium multiflorum]